jgi:CarD family transcriptional regulator
VSSKPDSLQKGDWILHAYYGIGQIVSIETKIIDKKKSKYFKAKTPNSTFFIPTENPINDRIRPLSSLYKLNKAKKILKEQPEDFPENHNERRKLISEFSSDRSMNTSAQIIRDLFYRKQHQGLNDFEQKTLETTEKLFLTEWAIIKNISEDEAKGRLEKIFAEQTW